ncbi:hypothetical protein M569_05875, partial [Genlisea aurea]
LSNSINEMKGDGCIIPSCYDLDEQKGILERKDGLGVICSDKTLSDIGSATETNLKSPKPLLNFHRKVTACLFSPDPSSYSGEVMVKLSRYMSSTVGNFSKRSWSVPFSLIPPTGTTSVILPQPSSASGYVLSVSSVAAPISGRTKVITFQPRYVITNTCTKALCYKQKGTNFPFTLETGQHSHIHWMDVNREQMISVRFAEPGWEWSGSFLPEQLGDTQVKLRNYTNSTVLMVRVEVRSADVTTGDEKIVGSTTGNSGTNLIILSDDNTGFMPYRIDNHSRERLRIYQPKCESFETVVYPYTSSHYAWDEPCYPHRLIIEVPGERILGSYVIDDTSAESVINLPATSEKPERILVVTVHSEGAIKVISIIDSNHHVLNGVESLRAPRLNDRGKTPNDFEVLSYNERISIEIPFLGVSLMNSHLEELLFVSARNTKVNFVQDLYQQQFSLQIAALQIDNQLHATPYPVILSFEHGNNGTEVNQIKVKENSVKLISGNGSKLLPTSLDNAVFSLAVSKWRNTDASLVSFETISLRMADFYLEIEQEIGLKLFEFGKAASSKFEIKGFQHIYSSEILFPDVERRTSSFDLTARVKEYYYIPSSSTPTNSEDFRTNGFLPDILPVGAPWQQVHIDERKQKKVYVEMFDISPIKLTL